MSARRITEMFIKKRAHRGSNRRIDRCAGVIIEIDAPHGQNTKTLSASAVAVANSSIALRGGNCISFITGTRTAIHAELIRRVRDRGARSLAENGRRGDLRPLTGSGRRAVGIQGPRSSRLFGCSASLHRGTCSPGKHRSADASHSQLHWSALCAACGASRFALSRRASPRRAPELRTDRAQALSCLCLSVAD